MKEKFAHLYGSEAERKGIERKDYMQTLNQTNDKKSPFNTGLLVNRIYVDKVKGKPEDREQLSKSIEKCSKKSAYIDI